MPWVRLDDRFHAHPKLAVLGDVLLPAVGLHVLALTWCADYLTDGDIPAGEVGRLGGSVKLATALVEAGLWERLEVGYRIHDFLIYNPSRADTDAKRERRAEAGRRGGVRSGEVRRRSDEAGDEPRHSNGEAASKPRRSRGEAADEQQFEQSLSTERLHKDRTRTPEPVPEPVPEPPARHLIEETPSASQAVVRPDVEALRQRWGKVSPKQIRVLDELLDRHDLSGPGWAAHIIAATPAGVDPLAAVIEADRVWQDERRTWAREQERSWATEKLQERATTPALDRPRPLINGPGL